jgi:hypothetical protein
MSSLQDLTSFYVFFYQYVVPTGTRFKYFVIKIKVPLGTTYW